MHRNISSCNRWGCSNHLHLYQQQQQQHSSTPDKQPLRCYNNRWVLYHITDKNYEDLKAIYILSCIGELHISKLLMGTEIKGQNSKISLNIFLGYGRDVGEIWGRTRDKLLRWETINSLVVWRYAGNTNSITGSGRSPEVGNLHPTPVFLAKSLTLSDWAHTPWRYTHFYHCIPDLFYTVPVVLGQRTVLFLCNIRYVL